jgi:uncharacterized membrane protein YedE/YeeE
MTELTVPRPLAGSRGGLARMPNWALLGVLFGLVSIASILLFGPIGVSGTYPRFIGEVWRALDPAGAGTNAYLVKMGALLKPETMLVVGLLIGGFLASRVGAARPEKAPAAELVHARETTPRRRYVDAFLGGVLLLFGARLAGGCTSGHIISGITQLAVSGFIFAIGVFAAGLLSARLIKARVQS